LPEYDIDALNHLQIADSGDVAVDPNDAKETMRRVFEKANEIYRSGSIPLALGGDHSFSPEIVRALSGKVDGQIGVIHFDAHLDNVKRFGNDDFPRCGPLHRIAQIEKVRNESIVQIGIRGPRNSPAQLEYAREMGTTVITTRQVRRQGIEAVIEQALAIAQEGTQCLYVTICSDVVDAAFNPGGPPDFDGFFPHELFRALYRLGESGIAGLDYVEVYPVQDPYAFSSHLAAWAIIHALAGLATRKRSNLPLF
jgi:agmatinase